MKKAKCPVDMEAIYGNYIDKKNKENSEERYVGKEHFYHASGAMTCSRKLYYESVERPEPTNLPNSRSFRIMRLGTIMHDDLQNALSDTTIYSNTTDSNTKDSKEKEIYNLQKESFEYHIEKEIQLPEFNVRGFYDLVAVNKDDGSVHLIDFKTMASYSWTLKFGRNRNKMQPEPKLTDHQATQLGTYGLAVKKEFGRLDSMWLYYYNKDNSRMKALEVPMQYLKVAHSFWTNVNDEHKRGLPMFRERFSPVEHWNCKYCKFLDFCNPPF